MTEQDNKRERVRQLAEDVEALRAQADRAHRAQLHTLGDRFDAEARVLDSERARLELELVLARVAAALASGQWSGTTRDLDAATTALGRVAP